MARRRLATALGVAAVSVALTQAGASAAEPSAHVRSAEPPEQLINLAVSCASAADCFATGVRVNPQGADRPLVERWVHGTWTRLPLPTRVSTAIGRPGAISCATAAHCLAVGWRRTAAGTQPLVLSWRHGRWAREVVPAPPSQLDPTATAVSCPAADSCTIVGYFDRNQSLAPYTVHWDGSQWTMRTPAVPGNASGAALSGVSCPTTTTCVAVGWTEGTASTAGFALRWSGHAWRTISLPRAADGGVLNAVSCVGSGACTAVGATSAGPALEVSLRRGQWRAARLSVAPRARLLSVSCPARRFCLAVGDTGSRASVDTGKAIAAVWRGRAWRLSRPPRPGNAGTELRGVSCASTTACLAVGQHGNAGNDGVGYSARWTGRHWHRAGPPAARIS